jgi:iron(III) transport system substrate-binding protein
MIPELWSELLGWISGENRSLLLSHELLMNLAKFFPVPGRLLWSSRLLLSRRLIPAFSLCLILLTSHASAQSSWQQTLAAAKREGRVIVAGPPVAAHREALMKFQAAFPDIKLELTTMSSGDYDVRVQREREADQYLWDVSVRGTGPSVFNQHIPNGWYEPIKPALLPEVLDNTKWLGGFDAGFMDKGKRHVYAFGLDLSGNIYVNRDSAPESVLQKVEDLLDPRWKGKIAVYDPRIRGPGATAIVALRRALGDAGVKRLLVDQGAVVTNTTRQLAEWLVRGRYPIAIGATIAEVKRLQKEGVGLNTKRLAPPKEVVGPAWGALYLLNRAPNPNAARVFANWLLGRDAQTAWSHFADVNSRRVDVPTASPEVAVDPKKLDDYLQINMEENEPHYAGAIQFSKQVLK